MSLGQLVAGRELTGTSAVPYSDPQACTSAFMNDVDMATTLCASVARRALPAPPALAPPVPPALALAPLSFLCRFAGWRSRAAAMAAVAHRSARPAPLVAAPTLALAALWSARLVATPTPALPASAPATLPSDRALALLERVARAGAS